MKLFVILAFALYATSAVCQNQNELLQCVINNINKIKLPSECDSLRMEDPADLVSVLIFAWVLMFRYNLNELFFVFADIKFIRK